jgi:hypothetical protein
MTSHANESVMEVEAKEISCGKFRFCNTLCVIAMIIAGCFVTGCSIDDEYR